MDWTVELDTASGREQAEERLTVTWADGRREDMRLHEYGRVYAVPGLYEEVVQTRLECLSPSTMVAALLDQLGKAGEDPASLRALDMGAGNGVVGEELRRRGVSGTLVGTDLVPEAKDAAERDRARLYAEFLVGDLLDLPIGDIVARHGLNCLVGAGALGPGHIPAASFDAAWSTFPAGSWLAVTAHEDVLDPSAGDVGRYVAELREGKHGTEVLHAEPFRHRLRMSGDPITYVALVARRR
jgi:hypothetical protein